MPSVKRAGAWFVGVDPGKSGGMVIINNRGWLVTAVHMPDTQRGVLNWFKHIKHLPGAPDCLYGALEKVGGYIDGVSPGPAMFNFGKGVGHLEMAMLVAGIPTEDIPPQRWQRGLKIPPRKKKGRKFSETKQQWKKRLLRVAQRLFPKAKLDLFTCDAALIALYYKRELA
jgi:hypothetical protein